jgi:adenosine deaminase
MRDHNILTLLNHGLCVTVNSDDPSYFGGYMTENFVALAEDLEMSKIQAIGLVENSIEASFASTSRKKEMRDTLEQWTL